MNRKTVPVEGTFALVTFVGDSYCSHPVYLHATGQPWYQGERIGTLGRMNGHGTYAQVGTPPTGAAPQITPPDLKGWFTGHVDQATAAQEIAGWHLGTVPTDPRLKVYPKA